MTDRVKGLYVAFEKDVRVDDVKIITDAINIIRGVAKVDTFVTDSRDWINREQIKHELRDKMRKVLWDY